MGERFSDVRARILCGRKVWVSERGGGGAGLKEIWVHLSPYEPAAWWGRGWALEDEAFLASCCRETIEAAPAMTATLARVWHADRRKPTLVEMYGEGPTVAEMEGRDEA